MISHDREIADKLVPLIENREMAVTGGDRDLELGTPKEISTISPPTTPAAVPAMAGAASTEPGSYVSQMRAAQLPVRFESAAAPAAGVDRQRKDGQPPPPPPPLHVLQPNRGQPPHYGMEQEPQCCLCSKVGRFILVTAVLIIITLLTLYIYWADILPETSRKGSLRMRSHASTLKATCGVDLSKSVTLTPPKSLQREGKMDWASICGEEKGSLVILRRRPESWHEAMKKEKDACHGFGDLESSFWLGPELVANITKTGSWDVRIDFEMTDGKKFHATYTRFSILKNHAGQYVYQLESAVPKESNMKEKREKPETQAAEAGEAGMDRLSSESMQKEFFDENLLPYAEAKNRKKRWSWGDGLDLDLDEDLDDDLETTVDDDDEVLDRDKRWGLDTWGTGEDAEGEEAAADDEEDKSAESTDDLDGGEATDDLDLGEATDDLDVGEATDDLDFGLGDALEAEDESEAVVEGGEENAEELKTNDGAAEDEVEAAVEEADVAKEEEAKPEVTDEQAADQAEDVNEGKSANAEEGDEKRPEEREQGAQADADQNADPNAGEDSGEGRDATFSPEAMGESEESAAKKDEGDQKGEEDSTAKTEDGRTEKPDVDDQEEAAAKAAESPSETAIGRAKTTTTTKRFYYPLVNAAFQPGDCFVCGDCKMCPTEISLTIFPSRK